MINYIRSRPYGNIFVFFFSTDLQFVQLNTIDPFFCTCTTPRRIKIQTQRVRFVRLAVQRFSRSVLRIIDPFRIDRIDIDHSQSPKLCSVKNSGCAIAYVIACGSVYTYIKIVLNIY